MKKKKKFSLVSWLIMLVGGAILAFPFVSQYIHHRASIVEIEKFEQERKNISTEEVEKRIQLAHYYNESLLSSSNRTIEDPYSNQNLKSGRTEYARMLEVHEQMGHVHIPNINEKLPIYAGTTDEVLHKGVGHMEGTSLPVGGLNTHSVLTAHRGLPNARLFTDLDKVKVGDVFYVHNIKETLAYRVKEIHVILPEELDKLTIRKDEDLVTLLTCTPYMINSHRLIVRAERIPYESGSREVVGTRQQGMNYTLIIIGSGVVCVIISLGLLLWKRKK